MGDAEVLEAFRRVTGWSDEEVLHYAGCKMCDPIGYQETWDCRDAPSRRGEPAPGPIGPLGAAVLQVWQPVIQSLLASSRALVPATLPKACYRTGGGLQVHVRPCTCSGVA